MGVYVLQVGSLLAAYTFLLLTCSRRLSVVAILFLMLVSRLLWPVSPPRGHRDRGRVGGGAKRPLPTLLVPFGTTACRGGAIRLVRTSERPLPMGAGMG